MRTSTVIVTPGESHARAAVLAYGTSRRVRYGRRVLLAAIAIALCACGTRWGLSLLKQWRMLDVQSQCNNWRPPPDQIIWDEDTSQLEALRKRDALFRPPPRITSNDVERRCPPWLSLQEYFCDTVSYRAPVFCHERTSPAGNRRLIVVSRPSRDDSAVVLFYRVIRPGSLFSKPALLQSKAGPNSLLVPLLDRPQPMESLPLRMYAGQPDDRDSSHFTISYEIAGQPGVVDAWLRDDESVVMHVRSGPGVPTPETAARWLAQGP